ncbi:alpha/beta hydrolase [Romeria aff. gracilis LEGE 07310]|uniref:Alpha/beta hydrolase n=1 Tax=Vasconcelosia minhoensis LEGE 07310 TaxID=915328 RepID=A0A8J7ASK9_9CYAN|nr:alpha/beta hydrolase [Romeria gracilis]MBE9079966.1 alpha/beta hydrolase [Romeria aff. gracilis LEGE 07310]
MQFYRWQGYRCAYEQQGESADVPALLLIHPVGVGLSSRFWQPFLEQWQQAEPPNPVYMPDLLGCGASVKPRAAYHPEDWAAQLKFFIDTVVQQPVILVIQGALLPVGIRLAAMTAEVKGLILSGPPNWSLMTEPTPSWQQRVNWNLFDSPIGQAFYQYARRRQFLRSFSQRQLFEKPADVSDSWLSMLQAGAEEPASRHAVFSFLAGFWRQDYEGAIAATQQPTLVLMGQEASSISRSAQPETPEQRLQVYLDHFPCSEGEIIAGRNVMPYETPDSFVAAIAPFIEKISSGTSFDIGTPNELLDEASDEPSDEVPDPQAEALDAPNGQSDGPAEANGTESPADDESNGQSNHQPDLQSGNQADHPPNDESDNEEIVDSAS